MLPSVNIGLFARTLRYTLVSYATAVALLVWIGMLAYLAIKYPHGLSELASFQLVILQLPFFIILTLPIIAEVHQFFASDFLVIFLPKPISRTGYVLSVIGGMSAAVATAIALSFLLLIVASFEIDPEVLVTGAAIAIAEVLVFLMMASLGALVTFVFQNRGLSVAAPIFLAGLIQAVMSDWISEWMSSPFTHGKIWLFLVAVTSVCILAAVKCLKVKDIT